MRLIDKGVINLEEIYAQKRAEIQQADHDAQAELARRVEEDKKIQEAEMKDQDNNDPEDEKGADL